MNDEEYIKQEEEMKKRIQEFFSELFEEIPKN